MPDREAGMETLSRTAFEELGARVLALCISHDAELLLFQKREALVRFAANAVIQNLCTEEFELSLRVFLGSRVGRATGNRTDNASLKALVERALQTARAMPEKEGSLPPPGPQKYQKVAAFSEETWNLDPEFRIEGFLPSTQERGFHQDVAGSGIAW